MSYCYFVTARAVGMVRIGYSNSPEDRLVGLMAQSPIRLTLEATVPGDKKLERALHFYFIAQAHHSEWFALNTDLDFVISHAHRFGTLPAHLNLVPAPQGFRLPGQRKPNGGWQERRVSEALAASRRQARLA